MAGFHHVVASIDALWRQVVDAPDDLTARLVLADALVDAGDNRGELIHLQCAGEDSFSDVRANAVELASELIAASWERWLGDLALVVPRQGSIFRDGMLHTIQLGMPETPAWAWDKIRGHRELGCVQRIRAQIVTSRRYVDFLEGLPRDPTSVEIVDHNVVELLAARRPRWGFRTVCYGKRAWSDAGTHATPVTQLAKICPDLERLELWIRNDGDRTFERLVADLPAMLPRLVAIRLTGSRWHHPDAIARLRALPRVEVVDD